MDDPAESSEITDVPLDPTLDLPPHNFVETEYNVVFSDPGLDAALEAARLRREDYDRYLGVTFNSTCFDWFPSKVIKRWGEKHCDAILQMIATINSSDIAEYYQLFTAIFASHPEELNEIANSRVEDVFAPEELKKPGKTYLKIVLWQLRDPTMSFDQHRQRDREIEGKWKTSEQATVPRNIRFNNFWREAYNKAVEETGGDPDASEAIGQYLHTYITETAPKAFASYIRSPPTESVKDDSNISELQPATINIVEDGVGSNGKNTYYRLHQRALSHPVPLTSPMDADHSANNSPGNQTQSISPQRRLVSSSINTADTAIDAPQESSPCAAVAAKAPQVPASTPSQLPATSSTEKINVTVTTTFCAERPASIEPAPNLQIHSTSSQEMSTPTFGRSQATAQPYIPSQAQAYDGQSIPQISELLQRVASGEAALHLPCSPVHTMHYNHTVLPSQPVLHSSVGPMSGMTTIVPGASHVTMGPYTMPVQAYNPMEQQMHQLSHIPQGSYMANIVPNPFPPQATHMGHHYNPTLISPHGPTQPFPPFNQDFMDPYAQTSGYNTSLNSSATYRQRGNSSSRGRGRGRRHLHHDQPAIFNHLTNQFEVIDPFSQSYQGPPMMAYQSQQSTNTFNQDRGNRERNYQHRDRNMSMGQFRDNSGGYSNNAPRRSSVSVHSQAHSARQYAQRESNFPLPVDRSAPSPTTPSKRKKKFSGTGSPSATQETRYASKGKRRRRPRSLSLTRPSTSQTPDESPALYGLSDPFVDDCELTEDRGSRKWYPKRMTGTPSRRANEKQQPPIEVTKSDTASITSIITNPSELAADVHGTLRRTSEGKLVYEFLPDSPIEKVKNTGSSITGEGNISTCQKTYSSSHVRNASVETLKPAIQPSAMAQSSQKHVKSAEEASSVTGHTPDAKATAIEIASIGQTPEISTGTATAIEEKQPEELMSKLTTADQHSAAQTKDTNKSEADTAIEKDEKILEKKEGEFSAADNDLTKDGNVVETKSRLRSVLGSESIQNIPNSTTALEVEQVKTTTLTDENSSPGQVKQEVQEKTHTEDLVDIPSLEEKSPHVGDDIKETVLEVAGNPRRVVSASGEIDVFWDAHETNSNPSTEPPRANTPSRSLPKETEETIEHNPEAQQESSKINSDIDVKTTYLDGESNEDLNTSGDPNAITGGLNLSSDAAQAKVVACTDDEVSVAPEQGSTLSTAIEGIKKSSQIALSSPATGKGKPKANPDSVESTSTAKDMGNKSDDNWVHPMARARRQAKQEKLQAKKEREKEKKAKQQAKKSNQGSDNISTDTAAKGKIHQQ